MKIDKKYYKNKISKIDMLLNDNDLLDKYILDLESSKLDVPLNLDEKIKLEINEKSRLRKNKYNFINILKVACFCLIVMLTWTAMTNVSFDNSKQFAKEENKEKDENKIFVIYGKVTEYTNNFSNFLLSPVENERGN